MKIVICLLVVTAIIVVYLGISRSSDISSEPVVQQKKLIQNLPKTR